MNPTLQCVISIRNAKSAGVAFTDWLKTDMGKLGLELTDFDMPRLHAIYSDCEAIRWH